MKFPFEGPFEEVVAAPEPFVDAWIPSLAFGVSHHALEGLEVLLNMPTSSVGDEEPEESH